jgi:hypothetical protein
MTLIRWAEKYADEDLLRELGQLVLQWLMDAEAVARVCTGVARSV